MSEEKTFLSWDDTDPRTSDLLARLMLDSVVREPLVQGQAIAVGVAYAQLTLATAMNRLSDALERRNSKEAEDVKGD